MAFMTGLGIYLLIGLAIGIFMVNHKEYNKALEETLDESISPDIVKQLLQSKQIVLIAAMWFGLPIVVYSLFTKEDE